MRGSISQYLYTTMELSNHDRLTNYNHIKFEIGRMSDIPIEFIPRCPSRDNESLSSPKYLYDVHKFKNLRSLATTDDPTLSNANSI